MPVDEQCEKKDEESGGDEREVHRRSDNMLLEVGDCVVYEDVSEAGNGDESQARNVSENGDGNEFEARHGNVSEAQDGDGGDDDESETQAMVIDNN
ncbi:hypothetical protein H5410_005749 [Solanum commersonii]|uniref:Uncharacterized protein n=1 Tax=Solanum commersonii TaxID=4109 RepID=A0A9J6A8C6_SOLCO|nr:hypothetical protein H5410_005749 [Solanum commersonii]